MSDEIAQRAFQTALAMDNERTLSAIQGRVRAFAAPFGFDRFVLFSASAAAEAGSSISTGSRVTGSVRGGGRCADLRAALPGDPPHAAGQRAVFLDQDSGAAG